MRSYRYGGVSYANPHAATQIANGVSSSTFSYDNNGNLAQKTTDGTVTTYIWDYANRLIALGVAGQGTTTYAYDWTGARVLQTGTSTTTITPFKWFSVASSTGTAAQFSTTTEYIFNGDALVSTVDQQLASGVAAGTAKTRYIHPDHLGSTNVVTDENGGVIETLDYFPYGATRISTGVDASARKYIGQFSDISGLSYFNARYYSSDRGQFISQDPVFLAIGDPNTLKQLTGLDQQSFLSDPQLANSTSYARGNPISNKDPKGLLALKLGGSYTIPGWGLSGSAGVYIDWNGIDYYYGTGLAAGGGASVTGQLTTANLPHVYSISTSVFTGGGYMYGAELSAGTTYYPYSTRPPQPYTEAGLGITPFKLTAGAMAEVSGPIWQWNKSPVINSSLPKPAMVSNVNFPNANTTAPAQNAPGSGGSSAFQRQVQIAALQLQVAQLQLQVIQLQTKARSN